MEIKRISQLAMLSATALIIFMVELQFPNIVPIPGVKPGLANIITVYTLFRYNPKETSLVVLTRILLGSLFSANPSSIIYSLSGAAFCLMGMLPLKKVIDENHIWLCSIIGAVLHNTGQISAAVIVMQTSAVTAYLPLLIVSGCISGALTGICAQIVVNRLS